MSKQNLNKELDQPAMGSPVANGFELTPQQLLEQRDDLLSALQELQREIRSHHKMNVKKDFSLMVADAAATKLIHKITTMSVVYKAPEQTMGKEWLIHVTRIGYGHTSVDIQTDEPITESEARLRAIDAAANRDISEKSSDYEVQSVTKLK